MGKSYKKSIIKDKGERNYNKIVRRVNKSIVNDFKRESTSLYAIDGEESENAENYWEKPDLESKIKNPKTIVNDYDYCDYIIDYEYTIKGEKYKENREKFKRK